MDIFTNITSGTYTTNITITNIDYNCTNCGTRFKTVSKVFDFCCNCGTATNADKLADNLASLKTSKVNDQNSLHDLFYNDLQTHIVQSYNLNKKQFAKVFEYADVRADDLTDTVSRCEDLAELVENCIV